MSQLLKNKLAVAQNSHNCEKQPHLQEILSQLQDLKSH